MEFLRVVELFPPLFPSRRKVDRIDFEEGVERFFQEAASLRGCSDVLLVADIKNPRVLKFSSLEAAALLKERLRAEAAPVLVVRDFNRPQLLSAALTAMSLGLSYVMLAWGDTYPAGSGATNVRDFKSLAEAVRETTLLRNRSSAATRLLAPVNVELLAAPRGVELAKGRLRAGAEFLLAQPPTTNLDVLDEHLGILRQAGLDGRVLLNVFPFKDLKDVKVCEVYFGWRLPKSLHRAARKGAQALFEAEKEVVMALRERGLPGVYLNARDTPGIVRRLLA